MGALNCSTSPLWFSVRCSQEVKVRFGVSTKTHLHMTVWYAYVCIFLGRWSMASIIFSKRSSLDGRPAYTKRVPLLKLKKKKKLANQNS